MFRDVATWVALATAVGVAIERFIAWRRTPPEIRKTNVESDLGVLDGASKLLGEMRKEREDMREQMTEMKRELAKLRFKVMKLETWVRAQGHDPLHIYDEPKGTPI